MAGREVSRRQSKSSGAQLALVAAEIVHDDNVARLERRHEELLDIGFEAFANDRSIKNTRQIQVMPGGHRRPRWSTGIPSVGAIGKNTALTWIRDLSTGHLVANHKDIPLLSEDGFESSLDTVREAAAGSIEGVFGPASLTWRVDREAAVFLGAGRALLLQLAHPWSQLPSPSIPEPLLIRSAGSTKRSTLFSRWCLARAIRPWLRPADCIGVMPR